MIQEDQQSYREEDSRSVTSTTALSGPWESETNIFLAAAHIEDAKFGRSA